MSFRWADYLGVARHLVEHSSESDLPEACLRAAISRAYYAALNTACGLLRDEWGIEVPTTAEVHSFIPRWFLGEPDADRQEVGLLLDRLRDRRRRADYTDDLAGADRLADRSLADAELLLDRISGL